MIKLKLVKTLDQNSEEEWRKFELNSNYNFFQSIDYIKNLIMIFNCKIQIIFLYFDNKLIAIYPLEIRNIFGIQILQWIGSNKSDYCSPIISNVYLKIVDKKRFKFIWSEILKKIGNIDLIFLNNQPSDIFEEDNPFVKFLDNFKQTKIYKIKLLENFEEYFNSIKSKDKNHAYQLHRINIKYGKLKKLHQLDHSINQIQSKSNDLNIVFFNKLRQLKLQKKKHYLNNSFLNLFKQLIKKKGESYYLAKLLVNNELVSMCFLIIFKDNIYYYMPVLISNKYNKFKPGKILLVKIIEWAIYKKLKFFDFGLGEENYKKYFSNNISFVQKHLSYNSFKGKIIFFICKFIIFLFY